MRRDSRLLADEHAVRVDERPAGGLDAPVGLGEQVERRRAAKALVPRREQRADVTEPGRAEHRVDERVREHVAVRVTSEPAVVLELDAAEDERHTPLEGVRIDADPDAQGHGNTLGNSSSERMLIAPAGGSWRKPHGPRRTCTATMPAASAGTTSLSTRSPTYAILSGGAPASSTTCAKNPGAGFCTPRRSDDTTKSTCGLISCSCSTAMFPAAPTTSPSPRRRARQATASGYHWS